MSSDAPLDRETVRVAMPPPERVVGVPITMSALSYTVRPRKPIKLLSEISGVFPAGKMTALMGPSGSGKTTLLDVVSGRKNTGKVEGEVLFGGAKAPRGSLKDAIGYVEQFDTLIGELTVRDMLMYTAQLRLPVSMSSDEKMQRVQEVIDRLGLGRCAGTVIGSVLKRGISGGQAKRVNIALALISRPGMIFLDEPTSGLDSFMANEVATCLSDLAREGRTVVCTIHSPTAKAFSLFDELLMLNAGRAIYGGPTEGALAYLESVVGLVCPSDDQFFSLPEWLVDITADAPPTEVRMAHSKSGTALDISPPPSEPPRIDFASIYAGSQIFKQRLALAEQIKSEAEVQAAPAKRLTVGDAITLREDCGSLLVCMVTLRRFLPERN